MLFYRDTALLVQRFDLKRFDVTGEAKVLLTDVQYQPQVKRAIFGVSDDGLLLAQTGSGVALSQPVWFDPKGKEMGVVGEAKYLFGADLFRNGKMMPQTKGRGMVNIEQVCWSSEIQIRTLPAGSQRCAFRANIRTLCLVPGDADDPLTLFSACLYSRTGFASCAQK